MKSPLFGTFGVSRGPGGLRSQQIDVLECPRPALPRASVTSGIGPRLGRLDQRSVSVVGIVCPVEPGSRKGCYSFRPTPRGGGSKPVCTGLGASRALVPRLPGDTHTAAAHLPHAVSCQPLLAGARGQVLLCPPRPLAPGPQRSGGSDHRRHWLCGSLGEVALEPAGSVPTVGSGRSVFSESWGHGAGGGTQVPICLPAGRCQPLLWSRRVVRGKPRGTRGLPWWKGSGCPSQQWAAQSASPGAREGRGFNEADRTCGRVVPITLRGGRN